MANFKALTTSDVKETRDTLNQLIDVLANDVSASITRRKYQVFVTGGLGPGVTSSIFQTVFDQDYTLQTANAIFDVTFGLSSESQVVIQNTSSVDSTTGKYYFPSQSLMMREKMDMYRQMASALLGNADQEFTLSTGSISSTIREALFVGFKRLMARDRIKRETFALKTFQTASLLSTIGTGAKIFTDIGSSTNKELSYAGQVSMIVDSATSSFPVGLLYLDKGVAVLDATRVYDTGTFFVGDIKAITSGGAPTGTEPFSGSLYNLFFSASMDDLLDHICSTRFNSTAETAIAFQNETIINSTLYFCRLSSDEFNYSSNPTYIDSNNRIVVIDLGQEESQRSFTFITSIGLFDKNQNLLAVAKLSRPALKAYDRDLTIKARIDY